MSVATYLNLVWSVKKLPLAEKCSTRKIDLHAIMSGLMKKPQPVTSFSGVIFS